MRAAQRNDEPAAEHAHAADRFAREIGGFLTVCVVRSQRLMGNPFGRWGTWSALLFREQRVSVAIARRAGARRAVARAAGVGRTPVVQTARGAECNRVRDAVPMNARRATWLRAEVVRSCGWQIGTRDQRPNTPMQPTASRARSLAFW